jgi:hypothetical protein
MKVEFEFEEEKIKEYVRKQIAQQIANKVRNEMHGWWLEDELKTAVRAAATEEFKTVITEMFEDYAARKEFAQPVLEKALMNRMVKAVKKLEG